MTMPPTDPTDADRPVLLWGPESDESQVHPSVERAAAFLDVAPEAVVAAIERGELLGGWFVDWEASGVR
ncbi:MAG TPA: hypothetical protein VFB66_28880 [Tepidisphaeraceae bacterium]|nr:hypothetical protein [Tepidisphaeraceae bacterium]